MTVQLRSMDAVIGCGGVGCDLVVKMEQQLQRRRASHPTRFMAIDTDRGSLASFDDDATFLLSMNPAELSDFKLNYEDYEPKVARMIQHHSLKRAAEDYEEGDGSSANRALTTLLAERKKRGVAKFLRGNFNALTAASGDDHERIQPWFVASLGGGAGSSLVCTLGRWWRQPDFRELLVSGGARGRILPPRFMLVYAENYVDSKRADLDRDVVLGNCEACLQEVDSLLGLRGSQLRPRVFDATSRGAVTYRSNDEVFDAAAKAFAGDLINRQFFASCEVNVLGRGREALPKGVQAADVDPEVKDYRDSNGFGWHGEDVWRSIRFTPH